MRAIALALLSVLLLAEACTSRPARHDRSGEISYNRRELPPATPGAFTGPDGTWTVYCNDAAAAHGDCSPAHEQAKKPCKEGQTCDPPPEPR